MSVHVVTGAFGYSGKYIAVRLLDRGETVRTLTNSVNRPHPFGDRIRAEPFHFDDPEKMAASLAGADVLYNVWVATRAKTAATQLAKQLVYSPTVRAKASPALGVALDLREAKDCEAIKGDTRTFRILRPLLVKRGCGPRKRDDCYECLREGSALGDAIAASGARPEPSFTAR